MLDNDPPSTAETPQSAKALAQERIRGLEERVAFLQGLLELERQRNAESLSELNAKERTRP